MKDLGSSGILSGLQLPSDGAFDISIRRILTRKNTNEVKAKPKIYRCLNKSANFDFLDLHKNMFYPISLRIVHFKITDDTYETVITNLPAHDFPPDELKSLYAMRWGIETSFRELKYTIGLTSFHAKKQERIVQEIFARIIMYNFTEMITSRVVISKANSKYDYQVNFAVAILVCRHFLCLWNNAPPPDVDFLIHKNVLPIRKNRKNIRNVKNKSAVSFIYRVA